MGDERRVACGDVDAVALLHVQVGDGLGDRHADADALVVGQRDDAADSPAALVPDQRRPSRRTRRVPLPEREKTACEPR